MPLAAGAPGKRHECTMVPRVRSLLAKKTFSRPTLPRKLTGFARHNTDTILASRWNISSGEEKRGLEVVTDHTAGRIFASYDGAPSSPGRGGRRHGSLPMWPLPAQVNDKQAPVATSPPRGSAKRLDKQASWPGIGPAFARLPKGTGTVADTRVSQLAPRLILAGLFWKLSQKCLTALL